MDGSAHQAGVTGASRNRFARVLAALVLGAGVLLPIRPAPAAGLNPECERGRERFEGGRLAEASEDLGACLETLLPPRIEARLRRMRAVALFQTGHATEAIVEQRRAVALVAPDSPWPLLLLAAFHRAEGEHAAALAAVAQAERFDEDGPGSGPGLAVNYQAGRTLYEMARYRDAVDRLSRGIARRPGHAGSLFYRALSYEALGDRRLARQDLRRLADRVRHDRRASAEVLRKLADYGLSPGRAVEAGPVDP